MEYKQVKLDHRERWTVRLDHGGWKKLASIHTWKERWTNFTQFVEIRAFYEERRALAKQ